MAVGDGCSALWAVVFLGFLLHIVACSELLISHSPDYVKFRKTSKGLDISNINDVSLATLGLQTKHEFNWDGLEAGNIFQRPKAHVLVKVEGFQDDSYTLDVNTVARYNLNTGGLASIDTHDVEMAIRDVFPKSKPLIVTSLQDDLVEALDWEDTLVLEHLSRSNAVDSMLISEHRQCSNLIDTLNKTKYFKLAHDSTPDMYTFTLSSYRHIVNKYGESSNQAAEARRHLSGLINQVSKAFQTLYHLDVVVEIVTLPTEDLTFHPESGSSRKGRSLMALGYGDSMSEIGKMLNLANAYTDDYPAIFNITLWTMLALAITLYGIGYCMWNMDNGKDSLYMMTTPRLKKE